MAFFAVGPLVIKKEKKFRNASLVKLHKSLGFTNYKNEM